MKAKPPHHVILNKDFAGIPTGSKLPFLVHLRWLKSSRASRQDPSFPSKLSGADRH
jgi:hypothetical protein